MDMFNIIGPVMIGPSSSHTAGAVRIGQVARIILGDMPVFANFMLHQSFARTCRGHGTDRALVAGLLGFNPDDEKIRDSFTWAETENFTYKFTESDLADVHPNSVHIAAVSAKGHKVSLLASSTGGGRICIREVNGLPVNFAGDYPTLLCLHQDRLGLISELTMILADAKVNIANMQVFRSAGRDKVATFVETDQFFNSDLIKKVDKLKGVDQVFGLPPLTGDATWII